MKLSPYFVDKIPRKKNIAFPVSFSQKRGMCQDRGVKQNAEFEVLQEIMLDGHRVQELQWGPSSRGGPTSCLKPKATNSMVQEPGG